MLSRKTIERALKIMNIWKMQCYPRSEMPYLIGEYKKDYDEFSAAVAELEAELMSLDEKKGEMTRALDDVLAERMKQDIKWGEQNHNPYIYLAILVEEIGEVAKSILHSQFGGDIGNNQGGFIRLRKEAVHTAAVALAIVECLDRNKWRSDDVHLEILNDEALLRLDK